MKAIATIFIFPIVFLDYWLNFLIVIKTTIKIINPKIKHSHAYV